MASCATTAFNLGDNISIDQVNYNGNHPYNKGFKGEYRRQTVKVSSLSNANGLGLYDMHGNVWEWVEDRYGKYSRSYVRYSGSHFVDPKGSSSGPDRLLRGGSWYYEARKLRSANRLRWGPGYRFNDVGLRLMRTANK